MPATGHDDATSERIPIVHPSPDPSPPPARPSACPHYAGQPVSVVTTGGAPCWFCEDCRKWVVVPARSPEDEARRRREQERVDEAAAIPVVPNAAVLPDVPAPASAGFRARFLAALDAELPDAAMAEIARAIVRQATWGDFGAIELLLRMKGEGSR
jgi:hypothetical protein